MSLENLEHIPKTIKTLAFVATFARQIHWLTWIATLALLAYFLDPVAFVVVALAAISTAVMQRIRYNLELKQLATKMYAIQQATTTVMEAQEARIAALKNRHSA